MKISVPTCGNKGIYSVEVFSLYTWALKKCLGWIELGGILKKDEISSQKREEKAAGGTWWEELLQPFGSKFLRARLTPLLSSELGHAPEENPGKAQEA